MKRTTAFKNKMNAIRGLLSAREYAAALDAVDAALAEWEDQPALLVLRGELIQLQDENGPPLEKAAESLKRATDLDERNGDAWLERGHFEFAAEDDAKAAEGSFSQAVAVSTKTLIAALLGRAAALEELSRRSEAFDCLSVARYLQNAAGTENGSSSDEAVLFDRWESLVGES